MDVELQLTANTVLQQCELCFKRGDATTLCFPWFSDFSASIYDDIRRLWERERSHSLLKLRITSTATFPIIIELMPSGSHEKAAAGLATLITSVFESTAQRYHEDFFVPLGATRVAINNTEKAADASFAPAQSDKEPSVVIEVGHSETIIPLRGDMARWFSLESVKLVILIEISKPSYESVHPNLSVEMVWFSQADKTLTQIAADWTTGIPGPLQIPLCTLLGSTEVPMGSPEELSLPVERLERLRNHIISAWTEEASLFDSSQLLC